MHRGGSERGTVEHYSPPGLQQIKKIYAFRNKKQNYPRKPLGSACCVVSKRLNQRVLPYTIRANCCWLAHD
jgi:hypothetical protein